MSFASMSDSLSGLLPFYVFVATAAWGLWGIFDKLALERSQPKDVFLATTLFALPQIPLLLFMLYWSQPQWQLTPSLLIYAGLSSLVSSLGMMLYLDSMKRTDTTVILSLTAAYPLVTQIVCFFFLEETFSAGRALGAVFIASGVVVIGLTDNSSPQPITNLPQPGKPEPSSNQESDPSFNHEPDPSSEQKPERLPVLRSALRLFLRPGLGRLFLSAMVVNVCWGLKGVFEKLSVQHGTPLESYFSECLTNLALLLPVLLWFFWSGFKPRLKSKHLWRYTGLSELALAVGGISYLTALSLAPASYVVTITSTYPLLMYFIALFVLNEKFNRIRLFGIVCIVVGGLIV